jgi:hypothetical protein
MTELEDAWAAVHEALPAAGRSDPRLTTPKSWRGPGTWSRSTSGAKRCGTSTSRRPAGLRRRRCATSPRCSAAGTSRTSRRCTTSGPDPARETGRLGSAGSDEPGGGPAAPARPRGCVSTTAVEPPTLLPADATIIRAAARCRDAPQDRGKHCRVATGYGIVAREGRSSSIPLGRGRRSATLGGDSADGIVGANWCWSPTCLWRLAVAQSDFSACDYLACAANELEGDPLSQRAMHLLERPAVIVRVTMRKSGCSRVLTAPPRVEAARCLIVRAASGRVVEEASPQSHSRPSPGARSAMGSHPIA